MLQAGEHHMFWIILFWIKLFKINEVLLYTQKVTFLLV
jgi:hypothetical protein